jgi:hypothetical protein
MPTVTATAISSGDVRAVLRLYDDTAYAEGVGAGIGLFGKYNDSGTIVQFGGIKVSKENGISGDYSASFYIQTRKLGSDPANALRLDSNQNGYIRNKLMVGSLDKTPANQLVVYNAGATDSYIQVANGVTGTGEEDGLIVGVEADGDSVLRVGYGKYLKFQCETLYEPKDMVTLRHGYGGTEVKVNGNIQVLHEEEGLGDGLTIEVDGYGDAVLRVDSGRFLKFQYETASGIEEMAGLRNVGGTIEFNVDGTIQCDAFRLDQTPLSGTITPNKYIIINCNGTDYKIPVAAV